MTCLYATRHRKFEQEIILGEKRCYAAHIPCCNINNSANVQITVAAVATVLFKGFRVNEVVLKVAVSVHLKRYPFKVLLQQHKQRQ